MFSSEFPRASKWSRIPVIAGLIAVGGAGVYGYFQYQQYLQDRQAQVIADEVKELINAPAPPLLATTPDLPTKLPVKSKVTAKQPAKTKEAEPDTPKPAPLTAKGAAQSEETATPTTPTPTKPVLLEENKSPEATLTFLPPTATLVLPQVVAVEAPPAASSQEPQLSSLITDLQSSLERAREEIKAEQSKRVSPR
jgi:hypothetical protein